MLSKRKAKEIAQNNTTITFEFLSNLVNNVTDLDGNSKVNPDLPRKYVINEIFKPALVDLRNKNVDFNAVIDTMSLNHNCKLRLNSHGMIMVNILRECNYNP